MTEGDIQLLDYLSENRRPTAEEISESIPFPVTQIESRLEVLEYYGLCYHVGNGTYDISGSDWREKTDEELVRDLSWRNVHPEEEVPVFEWLNTTTLPIIKRVHEVDGTATLEDIEKYSPKLETSAFLSRCIRVGIAERVWPDKFQLTEKGGQLAKGEISVIEAVYDSQPLHTRILYRVASFILAILNRFDPNMSDSVKNLDRAGHQAKITFTEQFGGLIAVYSLVVILITSLIFLPQYLGMSVNLQAIGLVSDIIGATFVALGLFRGKRGLAVSSEDYAGRIRGEQSPELQPASVRESVRSTLHGVFGTFLLIGGFTLQLYSVLTSAPM